MMCISFSAVILVAIFEGTTGASKGLGEKCTAGSDTCTSNPESVCDNVVGRCLIKYGQSCAGTALANLCVSGAECDSTSSQCACKASVYTQEANTGKCTSSGGKWGVTCTANADCTGTDVICVSGVCVCNEGLYVDLATGDCTESIFDENVGKPCTDSDKDTSCGTLASTHLECPPGGGKCDCATGYVGPSGGTCYPFGGKIGGGCLSDTDCNANNDTCASNVCECATKYSADGLDTCKVNDNELGGSCTVSGGGSSFTKGSCSDANAVCTDTTAGTCVCKKGYSGETAGTCAINPNTSGGACTTATANQKGSCTDIKHECSATSNGVCSCKTGYKQLPGEGCRLKVEITAEDCTVSGVVCVENSMCDSATKQCKCKEGYQKSSMDTCEPVANALGGSCSGTSCTDTNAECTTSTCVCKSNYAPEGMTCKLKVSIVGSDCTATDQTCVMYSSCGSNKQCSCNKNFKEDSGKCLPVDNTFGGLCSVNTTYSTSKGTCSDANAVCDYGKCSCKSGFAGTEGGGCASGASSVVVSALALLLVPAAHLLFSSC